jgi:hypothetical protein
MHNFNINEADELIISPAISSSSSDFDFYFGKWNIKNKKLKTRLVDSEEWIEFDAIEEASPLLRGFGNMNRFVTSLDGKPFEGMAVRLFNPQTKLWSIYWADSNVVSFDPPQVGSFDGDIGKFYAWDVFNGQQVLVLFQWDKSDPDYPVWSQAFSTDRGKTWEWNWYMYASRANG